MKLTITNPQKMAHFSTILHHLKQFTDIMVIYFDADRLYVQGLDGCHCCLFECKLTSQWFDLYDFDAARDQPHIGVNIGIIDKIMSTRCSGHQIELMVEPASDNLGINFVRPVDLTGTDINRYFELPLIDIASDLMEITDSETSVDLTMNTLKFQELMSQMSMFSSEVQFAFGEDNIKVCASGHEGSMRTEIKFGDVQEYAVTEGSELTQGYSLKYINMICNFHKLNTNELRMGFSETRPMHVRYGMDCESYVSFYLAPKMED